MAVASYVQEFVLPDRRWAFSIPPKLDDVLQGLMAGVDPTIWDLHAAIYFRSETMVEIIINHKPLPVHDLIRVFESFPDAKAIAICAIAQPELLKMAELGPLLEYLGTSYLKYPEVDVVFLYVMYYNFSIKAAKARISQLRTPPPDHLL